LLKKGGDCRAVIPLADASCGGTHRKLNQPQNKTDNASCTQD
jgi:hypothetical protein